MDIQEAQNKTISQLAEKYSALIFDLDGIIFHGDKVSHHTAKTLTTLYESGKKLFFITRNIKHPRSFYVEKLKTAGFEVNIDNIYNPLHLSLAHIKLFHPNVKKLYVIADEDTIKDVEASGFNVVSCIEHAKLKCSTEEELRHLDVDFTVGGVLVGFTLQYNYYMLSYASILIEKGAQGFSISDEPTLKVGNKTIPGTASINVSIERVTLKQLKVIGNINADAFSVITKTNFLNKAGCLLLGARLETDILYGKNSGVDTCLVLCDSVARESLEKEKQKSDAILPNFVCENLSL